MFMAELMGPLEAVLFASGDPVSAQQLKEIFGIDDAGLAELLSELEKRMEDAASGLTLQQVAGGWQMVTKQEFFTYVEKLSQTKDKRLSPAAMETLSIIAFKQPITKQEIEHIRGVHVEKVLAKLVELELVRELGRKDVIGRPILYGTTDIFLKCFGLNKLEDLPALPAVDSSQLDPEQLLLIDEGTGEFIQQ